jgi:hypothetical protein
MANPGSAQGNPDFIADGRADTDPVNHEATLAIGDGSKARA